MLSTLHLEGQVVEPDLSPSLHANEEAEPPSPVLEQVDPYTLYVIDQLFPGQNGIRVLAGLLRQATVKQLALPEFGLVDASDVAVVTVQNMRLLSRMIGIAYDTLEKYIVVLDRLRLFHKKRSRRQIVLYFPLRRYQLPEPSVFDPIQELRPKSLKYRYRPKVRSFADQVKRRFVLLHPNGSGEPSTTTTTASRVEPQQLPELLMADIRHIIQKEVDSDVASRLLIKVEGAVRYRCTRTQSRLSAPKGDSDGVYRQINNVNQATESPIPSQKGDSDVHAPPTLAEESRQVIQTGDSVTQSVLSESPIQVQKGDSDRHSSSESPHERRLSLQNDDSFTKKGDFDSGEPGSLPLNVNVLTFKNIINVNVGLIAAFCCRTLDEPLTKRGIYLKLFWECDLDADAIAGALIYTLVHRRDGTMRKPPAIFIKLCREYHRIGVPDEATTLVQQYGSLPCAQLLTATASPPSPALSPACGPLAHQADTGAHHQASAPPSLPVSGEPLFTVRIQLRTDGGMNQQEAMSLRVTLAHDSRLGLCRTALAVLKDGSYAVLVDNTVTSIVRQVAFYSVRDWQERSVTITGSHALFSAASDTPAAPHPLRVWRQQRHPRKDESL